MIQTPCTLSDLAKYLGAEWAGDGDLTVTGVATLQQADASQISFLANPVYKKYLESTHAGSVILHPDLAEAFSGSMILSANPYATYAAVTKLFSKDDIGLGSPGVHASAVVSETAKISSECVIGPNAVVESGVVIGQGSVIGAGSYIGVDTVIGSDCRIGPNVSIGHDVKMGDRCILHSGVVVGADGFGFAPNNGRWDKIYHLASVVIGDDVELGANTCVDRGALESTIIGTGVKTDNMVQIAHGVKIGEHTVIAGCTAVAGSTEIGAHCVIAGGVGIVGHIKIVDAVTITAMSLVTKSITAPGTYSSGTPFGRSDEWRKNAVRFNQLDSLHKEVKSLRDSLGKITQQMNQTSPKK